MQVQPYPGRDDQLDPRRLLQDIGQHGCRLDNLLKVVQHQQHGLFAEQVEQLRFRLCPALENQPQGVGDCRNEQICRLDGRELHQVHTVGKGAQDLIRYVQRQACLADPAGAGQRDQPARRLVQEQSLELGDLGQAVDKGRARRGQGAPLDDGQRGRFLFSNGRGGWLPGLYRLIQLLGHPFRRLSQFLLQDAYALGVLARGCRAIPSPGVQRHQQTVGGLIPWRQLQPAPGIGDRPFVRAVPGVPVDQQVERAG